MVRANKVLNPRLTGKEAEKLDSALRQRVVGQEEAIGEVVRIYQTYLAGMISPGRPIGNLLFLGPTGSGKTRLVEAMAEALLGDARALIKVDCAEFQHSHEIAKLIGSPPGYLGHRETHPLLSQEALNLHHTEKVKLGFVLFDEVEKASDALWNLLLGILDKATLTLGDNRRVDFSRSMIFLTSNVGATEMAHLMNPRLGFLGGSAEPSPNLEERLSHAGVEAARRKFTPEFLNRIDRVVTFRPLGDSELRSILNLELQYVQERIFDSPQAAPFLFQCSDDAKGFLLRAGTDLRYGARHLKRALECHLVYPLANLIASGQVKAGDVVRVDLDSACGELSFFKEAEGVSVFTMARPVEAEVAPAESLSFGTAVSEETKVPARRVVARTRK